MALQLHLPDPICLPIESSSGQLNDTLEGEHEDSIFEHIDFTKTSFIRCRFNNVNITDSKLSHCTITNCIVRGCLLVDCTVKTSNLGTAKIQGGKLQKSQLEQVCLVEEFWARDCNLTSCRLFGGTILRSRLADSYISGLETDDKTIQSSTLKGCMVMSFYVDRCTADGCILEATTLNVCKLIRCSTTMCNIKESPLALRRFAPEIRAMIFSHVKIKTLIAAFHRDSLLYGEIMELAIRRLTSKPFLLDKKGAARLFKLPSHSTLR